MQVALVRFIKIHIKTGYFGAVYGGIQCLGRPMAFDARPP